MCNDASITLRGSTHLPPLVLRGGVGARVFNRTQEKEEERESERKKKRESEAEKKEAN